MLLIMGEEAPETCWATHKRQVINLWNCCIFLVNLFESFFPAFTGVRWWTPFYKSSSNSNVLKVLRNVRFSNVKLSSPSYLCVLLATYWNPAAGRFLRPQPDTSPCCSEQEPTQRGSECFCYSICYHEWICSSDQATENVITVVSYRT
jgi:hypothetical protein